MRNRTTFANALAEIDPDPEEAGRKIEAVLTAYADWLEEREPTATNSIGAARQAGDEATTYWEDLENNP